MGNTLLKAPVAARLAGYPQKSSLLRGSWTILARLVAETRGNRHRPRVGNRNCRNVALFILPAWGLPMQPQHW